MVLSIPLLVTLLCVVLAVPAHGARWPPARPDAPAPPGLVTGAWLAVTPALGVRG
ncbi:MAG: hypothetical protein AB7O21_00880 [Gammaproteobacteria bacterium]